MLKNTLKTADLVLFICCLEIQYRRFYPPASNFPAAMIRICLIHSKNSRENPEKFRRKIFFQNQLFFGRFFRQCLEKRCQKWIRQAVSFIRRKIERWTRRIQKTNRFQHSFRPADLSKRESLKIRWYGNRTEGKQCRIRSEKTGLNINCTGFQSG